MDDLIRRQDAISLLKKWSDGYAYIENKTELAIKEFQELPSAQPRPQWILCSERLPDDDGEYLTTLMDKGELWIDITEWECILGGRWICSIDECDYSEVKNVVAWMPLPEPPQVN